MWLKTSTTELKKIFLWEQLITMFDFIASPLWPRPHPFNVARAISMATSLTSFLLAFYSAYEGRPVIFYSTPKTIFSIILVISSGYSSWLMWLIFVSFLHVIFKKECKPFISTEPFLTGCRWVWMYRGSCVEMFYLCYISVTAGLSWFMATDVNHSFAICKLNIQYAFGEVGLLGCGLAVDYSIDDE